MTAREEAVSEEALARRARTVERLRAEGVPVHPTLPCIEDSGSAQIRSQEAIVDRLLALFAVCGKGEQVPPHVLQRYVDLFRVRPLFTDEERAFFDAPDPPERDLIRFTWRYECLGVLLWAVGYLRDLPPPNQPFSAPELGAIILGSGSPDPLRAGANRRAPSELLDFSDLMYRYDWAVTDARLTGKRVPALHPGVVVERDYASRWLVGYGGQAWDDISLDT